MCLRWRAVLTRLQNSSSRGDASPMRSASASGVSVGSSPSPRSSSIVTSPDVKISVRGIMRVGRFLSHTQTSSSFRWKNGYVCWGTYVRSSLLQRYVASWVSTQ